MDQSLYTFFKLNKNAVVSDADNLADSLGADGVALRYRGSGVWAQLLDSQRYPV